MARNNPYALKFNKSVNTKVVIPKKPQITPATNLTVMLWAFFPKTPSELQIIIANIQTGGYSIWVDSSTIRFEAYIGGSYRAAIYNHSVIPETWYMLAGTYNGSQLVFYVNGEEVANVSYSGSITYHSSTPLVLSGNPDDAGNITDGPFEGIIDNVSVWNKTLTPEEIKYYMRRKLRGDEEGLAGYWPLDEGQGNIAHDLSPYQNCGTIYNAQWVEGEVDLELYNYSLIKSNNKYYTYQDNEFIEVEPTVENFKENFVDLSQLTTPNENGIKPYKLLDKPSIVTYSEDDKVPLLFQTVLASTKVRFLVSKDKTNYQVYRNSEWITIDKDNILEQGMAILELESIPQEAWAEWFENEAHKHSFDILVGVYSENPNTLLMRSITVNYAENESPIIINAYIEPDTIHNEFATLKAHVKDYEGDKISFKVLIKKAGSDEFVQVSPLEGWYNRSTSDTEITQAFNFPYFNPGENEVKLVVKDERGAEAEWTGRVILSNTDPTITIAYDDFSMRATIGDDDNDMISYRIAINGELVFDYTDFVPSKTFVNYVFDTSKMKFGEENIITIEVKDTHGGYAKQEFAVIGSYRGLMFKNENGEYFVNSNGEVLMDLLFDKTLIAGQISETKKVILENRHEFPITNVQIKPDNPNFVKGAVLEISETEMPFTPKDIIKVLEIMPSLGEKDFYVRVKTDRSAHQGGYFYIKSTATPVLE